MVFPRRAWEQVRDLVPTLQRGKTFYRQSVSTGTRLFIRA